MSGGMKGWGRGAGLRILVGLGLFLVASVFGLRVLPSARFFGRSVPATAFAQGSPILSMIEGSAEPESVVRPRGALALADQAVAPRAAVRFRVPDSQLYRNLKQQLQHGTNASQLAAPSLATSLSLSALTSFAGLNNLDGIEPPDTQLAAGPTDLLEMVNLEARIFTKTGVAVSTQTLNSFFGLASTVHSFDPKVRFDPISGRYFAVLISENGTSDATSTSGQWNLLVSASNDPTGSFVVYRLPSVPSSFPSFPQIGISDDKIVLTGNTFSCTPNCGAGTYLGNEFLVLNKSELLSGATVHFTHFDP